MGFKSGGGGGFSSGRSDLDSDLTINGSVKIKEGSAADADVAGQGQLWVKSDTPNNLYFTDDAGNDVQITSGGTLAAAGGTLAGLGSTDNAILRANGTGGETAQGSGITIDDSNNFTIPTTGKVQFRDTGLFINSSTNGQLDIDADTELELTAPTLDIAASTEVTIASPAVTVSSSGASEPILHITNTNAGATSGELRFNKDSASGATSDVMGLISFYGTDSGNNTHERLAYMDAIITDAADGSEAASLRFYVAENDATLTRGLLIAGQPDHDGEVDVTLGAGAASETTIAGTLIMGSTAAMTNAGLLSVGNQSNITGVGALASGTIAAGFGAIDNGTSGIRTNIFTAETSIVPDASGGADIGSTSAEWGDVYLADGKSIKFGNDQEITLTHAADIGLILAAADSNIPVFEIQNTHNGATGGKLKFNNTEAGGDAADDDVLGTIEFWGNDDGTPSVQRYAAIFADVHDATSGQESGRLKLQVASHDGGVETGLILEGGAADTEVNVTIGNATTSTTTIAGTLDLGDRNIVNVGDIDCDSISIADAASGLIIDTNGSNNQTSALVLTDNLANSFAIRESSNVYMGFATTDGSELITISKDLTVTNDTTTFTSANSNDPLVLISNTTNDAGGARLRFLKNRGAAGQAGDECGEIQFNSFNDAGTPEEKTFARIKAKIFDRASGNDGQVDGEEGGQLTLQVASHNGTVTTGLKLMDGNASGEVDVDIGAGAASVTTVQGLLKIKDDTTLVFGDDDNATFEYDEDGTDRLLYAGAGLRISDDVKLEFGTGGDATIEYDEDGDDVLLINGAATKFTVDGVEIENSNSGSGPALLIDNDNVDANALDIDAANTTANVVDIAAASLIGGNALSITATGGACKEAIKLTHSYSDTTAVTSVPGICPLHIDFDKTGDSAGADKMTGLFIDMDNTTADGGDILMRGLLVTPTLTLDSNTDDPIVIGGDFEVTGHTNGQDSIARGLDITVSGADYNQGIHINSTVALSAANVAQGNHMKFVNGSDSCTFTLRPSSGGLEIKNITTESSGAGFNLTGAVIITALKLNGEIVTTIQVDLTGMRFSGSDKQIIGEDGAAAAQLTQILSAKNGYIYKAEMACVETPVGTGTDQVNIDLCANSQSLAESAAWDDSTSSATSVRVIDGGDQALGLFNQNTTFTGGLADKYLYLAGGDSVGSDANFTAGKFLIKLYGAVIS